MLYLIATPIGNLEDITFRAVRLLKECELILCEDTRVSQVLMKHYEVTTPLKSFHQFNEASKEEEIVEMLQVGKNIALISDAGTPAISDPGERLVKRVRAEGLDVCPIPGPSAVITAVSASGLSTQFQFIGFLPRKTAELKKTLIEALNYSKTTVCYESPNRIQETLKMLNALDPERKLVVARELTKKFEEWQSGTAEQLLNNITLKGEMVLLIAGQEKNVWDALSPEEHVQYLMDTYTLSQKEAIKLAAEMRGVPKRDVYNLFHS